MPTGKVRGLVILRHFGWILACLIAAAVVSGTRAAALEEATSPIQAEAPSYFVILDQPADLGALLQKIRRPDVEVRRAVPGRPDASNSTSPAESSTSTPWVVESVRIRGNVRGDSATITVEFAILTSGDGPTWVPIRLDGQRLIDAREGDRVLDLRRMPDTRWQIELIGRGRHQVSVPFRCPLTTDPARESLVMEVPETLSTALELDFQRREPDLIVGENEVYGQSDLLNGQGARLTARLSPRSRVVVSWAVDSESGRRNPPILVAQGDIALDVDPEQMRTRSTWVIRCVRGMTRTLQVRVPDRDEVTEVRLDDQQVTPDTTGARHPGLLTIPLSEPLRPGGERRFVMTTRRPHVRGEGNRIDFRGFPIVHAREQTGAIGVTQSPDLWIAPTAAQGLRRIVPTYLPRDLAERPGTSLAFEFLDQPFALALGVESSPPVVRARTRSSIRVGAERARSETAIDLRWVRGRPFEVRLKLGPGLELTSVGPASMVEAWNLDGDGAVDRPRALTVRLSPSVRDQPRVTLQVEGVQRLPTQGPIQLGLCAPEASAAVSVLLGIAADRGVSVELDEEASRPASGDRPTFRVAEAPTAPTTAEALEATPHALSLEATGGPDLLPLRITRLPIALREETTLQARVSRQSVELVQRTTVSVRHGAAEWLSLQVPASAARWELRDHEILERKPVSDGPDHSRIERIRLDRPILDRAVLEFRWQVPIDPPLSSSAARELSLDRITFPGVEEAPSRVELSVRAGVTTRAIDPAWVRTTDFVSSESTLPAYVEGAGGTGRSLRIEVEAHDSVVMPVPLVPRLLIQTTIGLDETVQHRASFRVESHGPAFPFELPEVARIIAARVDGRPAERVDLEGGSEGARRYRLPLPPASAARPVLVELEYQLSDGPTTAPWPAPRLPEGGLVLRTLWEVQLPWDRALLGVPTGWSDENSWGWDGLIWGRRPDLDPEALEGWLVGEAAPSAIVGPPDRSVDASQRLLFGQTSVGTASGTHTPSMAVRVVSRAALIAVCSGSTLLIGFLALFTRIRFRTAWLIVAAIGLLGAFSLEPDTAIQLAQSSLLGAALTVVGILIEEVVQHRRARSLPVRDPVAPIGLVRGDSSVVGAPLVGSDDPTAIRVRTPSTMDFVPSPLTRAPLDPEESRGSPLGRA